MNSIDHDFGHSEYTYQKGLLQLRLSNVSNIVLSSAEATKFPFSQTFRNVDKLISTRAWVAKGHRLQFAFHLEIDNLPIHGYKGADHTDLLARILCNAEV